MDNEQVASMLLDISRLQELEGEDSYKIRAYRKASQSIASLDRDINDLYREGRLQEIPGVGRSIEGLINELLSTGRCQFYEDLKKEIPPELYDVMSVPGIGRKAAVKIHKVLGATTISEFRKAARERRIRNIRGMGEKIEKRILESIDSYQKMREELRIPIFRGLAVASEIGGYLKDCDAIERLELAGSLRRRATMVRDVNFLAASSDPKVVIDHFCNMPITSIVKERGANSARIITIYRVEATINVVDGEDWGLHMVFATGSKGHLQALTEHATKKGIELDNTGYINAVTAQRMQFLQEKALYGSLELEYISPELREGKGEIEAALNYGLPDLIELSDIKGDLHVHSAWSDGANSIQDIAMAARARGYEYVAICDHSVSLTVANGLSAGRLREQMAEIDRLNDTMEDFTILKGCEVDIKADGSLDLPDSVLEELDIVIGSIHVSLRQEPEVITQRVLKAFENEYLTVLAHPTSRILGRRGPTMIDIDRVIEAAIDHGKVLEVNSYPDRLDLSDENVKKAMDAGAMVCIDTDSHSLTELDFLEYGVGNARRGWAPKSRVLNAMPCNRLLEFLEMRI
ncbi:DNA polymerase/3'-5' exonuclease PolX [Methanocella sp. CWC-04]|uniref:DNA-directed DNA polymerase n=1 Tax=Methanooceanicella nereidis TaxID=2052831 RepID=A0AAP2RC81_9EURY|nr:DNA polymerase/3'-5' exonuclease PolX [Methanocella sp. CWC-04]MCD1294698.1 DNA polymerase/3'-5' exonuclease PolX [Methanocella sp. CWC-04]